MRTENHPRISLHTIKTYKKRLMIVARALYTTLTIYMYMYTCTSRCQRRRVKQMLSLGPGRRVCSDRFQAVAIGVGDGGGRGDGHGGGLAEPPSPQKNREKYFSGNYYVKFGHFVNFSYIFGQKCIAPPPKLTELLRLWQLLPPREREYAVAEC